MPKPMYDSDFVEHKVSTMSTCYPFTIWVKVANRHRKRLEQYLGIMVPCLAISYGDDAFFSEYESDNFFYINFETKEVLKGQSEDVQETLDHEHYTILCKWIDHNIEALRVYWDGSLRGIGFEFIDIMRLP